MNRPLQKIGAFYDPSGSQFIVWAPLRSQVELLAEGHPPIKMNKDQQGYWSVKADLKAGTDYRYRLDGETAYPDPASIAQPNGVHGPSRLTDLSVLRWTDDAFTGLPLEKMIIYELHVGCFTPQHDFEGVIGKLDYLVDLGINAIELMPLGCFDGDRNWGYDGVNPFAIQSCYGGVEGFQQLVDAAHARGIAVIVDVVYNHIGPEGNYLASFGPYFTDKYKTPWGEALNFDDAWCDGVRNYFAENARYWLEELHVDGLRLDAVHAIKDLSAYHFAQQLSDLALDVEIRTGKKKVLIAELDLNDPRVIDPADRGGYGLDGQWVDEFHHALHALVTGERMAWYEDFGSLALLEKAFRDTYVYDGVWSQHRHKLFGSPVHGNPYSQFVVFSQNHDQVGNRAQGDRLTASLSLAQLKFCAAAVLLSPYVPLLFMGEEYGETNPFQFFVSFNDEKMLEAVRKGRQAEFTGFANGKEVPDPGAVETFEASCLSWDQESGDRKEILTFYKELIHLRTTRKALQGTSRDSMVVHPSDGQVLHFERTHAGDTIHVWLDTKDYTVVID